MKKKIIKSTEPYLNTFNQTVYQEREKELIKCNVDEFNAMLLNKEYLIVAIKRNEKSEFLFQEQPKYLSENVKYIIFNFKYGLAEATFTEKLDNNDMNLSQLEIV